jgi:hypothetical protein
VRFRARVFVFKGISCEKTGVEDLQGWRGILGKYSRELEEENAPRQFSLRIKINEADRSSQLMHQCAAHYEGVRLYERNNIDGENVPWPLPQPNDLLEAFKFVSDNIGSAVRTVPLSIIKLKYL